MSLDYQSLIVNFFNFTFTTTPVVQSHPLSISTLMQKSSYTFHKGTALAIPLTPFPSPAMPSPHLESGILPSANSLLTPASPEHIPAIGRIQVNKTFYEVLNVLFSSTGFLGRGTVCYLTCYNGEYYVIKDYWVEELEQRTALHEVNMMKLVQDIDRVPKLQHYWVIEVELGIPCARPMVMFKTKKELDSCIQDILQIQQQALKRGVLHRDCSINNTMIEDFTNVLHSFLLNWEFAVWVMLQGEYDLGGTMILNPCSMFSSGSSFLYDGPLGHKHQDISHEKTLLGLWSEKAAKDLKIARCAKFTVLNDPSESRLDSKVLQCFQHLIPLANDNLFFGRVFMSYNNQRQVLRVGGAPDEEDAGMQENVIG
ncbi:hypothetical protein F5J12DRAFT_785117 [Pisolithus orientalis]|uniref:uncharacterized protein n=1 Tax=Pisolithus orientalis TaxID=936130 RepID=UPI0022249B3E|nr:uncharacterized protein F5J12DRAFT_785117 [Pisolithus orientalis]KAI5997655.1 hypothetical protein F5J12DRAFT_785117 [Pisolithus orientalis]